MSKTYEAELRQLEKEARKLRNSLKRNDLEYTVQVSIKSDSPGMINYALSMPSPAAGLAPIMFLTTSIEDLSTIIKAAQKKFDPALVERSYHEAQIEACKNTIKGHEGRLQDMDKEENEDVDELVAETEEPKNNT